MAHTAIVILNWNGREFLRKFLPLVIEHSSADAEIIVADNASTDSSVEMLQVEFPSIRIIQNQTNGGFAKGYNDALAQVKADYYVLLNSDIEVTANWLKPIIDLMENDKTIAACQPKLLSWHEREAFEYAGAAGGFIDKFGYPFCRGRIFQSIEKDEGQYNDTREVFWATGACMFVRAELYHKHGGLDDDFFAHMEEIDFCWRLKNAGHKIMYCAESTVYHIGGGTLPKQSWRKTYLNFRNNISLLYKNLPASQIIPVFAVRFPLDGIAAIKFLIDSSYKDFYAVIRAHFHFYKNFRKIRKKRLANRPHIKVGCVYESNLVIDHYFGKKKLFSQLERSKFSCNR